MVQFNFKAIGTSWQIDVYREMDRAMDSTKEALLFSAVKERIELFESTYSRFRENSIVTQTSKEEARGNVFELPEDAEKMFSLYRELYDLTDGYFTPLIGNLLSDAGYDAKYSLESKKELKAPPAWDETMIYNHPNLLIKKPTLLDFGAAGKGYIIDIIGKLLEENKIMNYCIDAGGDILHKNVEASPLRIGLENPENTSQVIGVCTLENGSLCGSAGNRRSWGNFNHIMNPKTLESTKEILAIWVKAESAMLADAMTTCLFFIPASTMLEYYKFEYCLMRKDLSIEKSANFSEEFFS